MMNMGVAYQISAQVAGNPQVAGLRREVKGLKDETAALPGQFKAVSASAKQFAAILGIGFGAEKIVELGRSAIESGGHIKDLASRTGLSTTAVQKLGYAAKLTGADIDQVGKAADKMNVKLGNALSGNNEAIKAFQQLGLDPSRLAGMNNDQRFDAIVSALSKVDDASLKAKLGMDVFGKGFAALLPIMGQGADSARALGDELERMGGVISPEDLERLDLLDDSLTKFSITARARAGQAIGFLVENSDELIAVTEVLAVMFASRLAVALALSTREYLLNTVAAIANARAQEMAALQATGNVRAMLAMSSASGLATRGLTGLVALMGGPLNVAIMAAGAAWYYTGTQLDANITRAAALRAVLITLRGEYEKAQFLKSSGGFLGIGGKSIEEKRAGVKAIQERIDTDLTNLRTPDAETPGAKALADQQKAMKEYKDSMAKTLAEIAKADAAADARSGSKSSRESDIKALQDYALKQQQVNEKLAQENEYLGMTSIEVAKLKAARELDDEAAQKTLRMQPDIKAKYLATADAIKQQRLELMQKNYEERRSFESGSKQALAEYVENVDDMATAAKDFWGRTFSGMEDALVNLRKTGKLNFKDLANSIIDDLIRIQVRSSITGTLASMLGSLNPFGGSTAAIQADLRTTIAANPSIFANGGIMTAAGSMPLRKYAGGGVANSPQVAIYGEGSKPEAYVPLPDGRSIPVTMENSGGGNIYLSVTTIVQADGSATTNSTGSGGNDETAKQLSQQMVAVARGVITKEKMPGGLLFNG